VGSDHAAELADAVDAAPPPTAAQRHRLTTSPPPPVPPELSLHIATIVDDLDR